MASRYKRLDAYHLLNDYEYECHVDGVFGKSSGYVSDSVYADKMESILSGPPCLGVPPEMTCILNGIYLGTTAQAENLERLKRNRITHILNVDGFPLGLRASRKARYKGTDIVYQELTMEDTDRSDLAPYLDPAHSFLDLVRFGRGRVLIADSGVNRGGAIALSYLVKTGTRLLEATSLLKRLRRVVLSNRGFIEQLVEYARKQRLLDPDVGTIVVPTYGRQIDRYRLLNSHLPQVL